MVLSVGRNSLLTVCGCYYLQSDGERIFLPQVKLDSHTTITPLYFTTKLTQTFNNLSRDTSTQLRYCFPLYDGVAVNGYVITYAGTKLTGAVQKNNVAKTIYQAAVGRGETAGLLESLPAGIFGVTLGNVPAQTDVVVEITYCGELKHDAATDGLRYTLPTAIAPRYGSYPGEEIWINTSADRGMKITVDIDMASSAIRKVQSPSHPIPVTSGTLSTSDSTATHKASLSCATLALGKTELAQDFILQLFVDDSSKPRAILETHPVLRQQRAIMTTLVPRFKLEPVYPEIVFIADQSGSMYGPKNTALVKALKVFLKSLPVGVRFNICAFGNSHRFLWPKSQAYSEANLKLATTFASTFEAAYGGTEILTPVRATFQQRLMDIPLEVMLLTDGEIWGEQAVFDFINEQVHEKKIDARVFALGIGGDVSHTLVEGVARAGNGFAQFVIEEEDTDQKVVRMLKGALYAHTTDYQVELHYAGKGEEGIEEDFEIVDKVDQDFCSDETLPAHRPSSSAPRHSEKPVTSFFDDCAEFDSPISSDTPLHAHLPSIDTPDVLQAPWEIPPLFPFNRTTIYLLLGPQSSRTDVTSITIRAKSDQGTLELNIPVDKMDCRGIPTVHHLAARKAIQELEIGRGWLHNSSIEECGSSMSFRKKYASRFDEIVEREGVRLGEKFQVAAKWTSFVAVNGDGIIMNTDQAATNNDRVHPRTAAYTPLGGSVPRASYPRPQASAQAMLHAPSSAICFGGVAVTAPKTASPPPPTAYNSTIAEANLGELCYGGIDTKSGPTLPERHATSLGLSPFAASPAHAAKGIRPMSTSQHEAPRSGSGSSRSGGVFGKFARKISGSTAFVSSASGLFGSSVDGGSQPITHAVPPGSGFGATSYRTQEHPAVMETLIDLQTFSGAWGWDAEVFAAMRVEESFCASWRPSQGVSTNDVKATALVIAFFQTRFSQKKEAWDLIVNKAILWLQQETGMDRPGVMALVEEARSHLPQAS